MKQYSDIVTYLIRADLGEVSGCFKEKKAGMIERHNV
jgi:hypothetical protein